MKLRKAEACILAGLMIALAAAGCGTKSAGVGDGAVSARPLDISMPVLTVPQSALSPVAPAPQPDSTVVPDNPDAAPEPAQEPAVVTTTEPVAPLYPVQTQPVSTTPCTTPT